jgi:hypothetical protein
MSGEPVTHTTQEVHYPLSSTYSTKKEEGGIMGVTPLCKYIQQSNVIWGQARATSMQ